MDRLVVGFNVLHRTKSSSLMGKHDQLRTADLLVLQAFQTASNGVQSAWKNLSAVRLRNVSELHARAK